MDDFLTSALAKFVLSFVATFLLVGFGWLFRSRKVQECQPPREQEEIAEVVGEPERFRWYYVFFILLGALAVLWLLPIIAGLMLAVGVMLGFAQSFRFRRLVDRGLRRRGKRWGGVRSFLVAPGVWISRFIRNARRHRHKALVFIAAVGISCAGAPGQTYWEDGNFKVYATDSDFDATKLGYDHRPGLLGLVEPEVVAAGSTAELVFVARRERGSGRREFFIVEKEESNGAHTGKVKGPFSEEQFEEIRKTRKLPEFAGRMKDR